MQIGVDGRPVEYGDPPNQYWRWRGCPGNPDFLEFINEKVINVALNDIGVDVVYFDNMCLFERHNTLCHCDCCRKGFRDFLAEKFPTPEKLFLRMGLRSVEDIEPPRTRPWTEFTLKAVPIKDPLLQEFIEFRCEQLADAWHGAYQHIKRVNPDAAIMGNPSFPRKYNERLTSAIDFWRLRKTPAIHYMENAVRDVGVRAGVVISNTRGYKYARVLGHVAVVCGAELEPALSYCECLAFQGGSGGKMREPAWPYRKFFEKHKDEFYRNTEELHEVAVLRHDVSLTWRWHESFTVMELAQHELLSAGLPWMPLWGQQLLDGTLEKYRVLVVPGCACLSREEARRIMQFVKNGGSAVILENAGCFDEYHHTISEWRFAPMFAEAAKVDGFAMNYAERGVRPFFVNQKKPLFAKYGRGQAAYLPQIRKTREPVRTYEEIGGYDGFEHLELPRNWGALPKAVEKVAGAPLAARVVAPRTVLAEFLKKSKRLHVHLVNYAAKKVPAGAQVLVAPGAGSKARLYLPGEGVEGRELKSTRGKGKVAPVRFRLPVFQRYALLVVE